MSTFTYQNDKLCAERVRIEDIAREIGTPFYVYSRQQIVKNYFDFDNAFSSSPHLICYALKANSNLSIGRILNDCNAGVDIVSGGELYRALKIGFPEKKIVFAGVGKTTEEIRYALRKNILMLNVESFGELELIDYIARGMKRRAPIAIRVNPGVKVHTHKYITTGEVENKFGIPLVQAIAVYERAHSLKNIEILGMHSHIGSQITALYPFVETLRRLLGLLQELEKSNIRVQYLNLGGGLGIRYKNERPPTPKDLARAYLTLLKDKKYTLILEPGRYIVGNAGLLVTKVLYLKDTGRKKFVIVDAGFTELIRPVLYNAYHEIVPVKRKKDTRMIVDVVGPICESSDYFAQNRKLRPVVPNELIAILNTGAYGFSMASSYNSRPKVPEILVDDKKWFIIRERETYADLIHKEKIT